MIELLNLPEFRERVAPISVELYHRMIDQGVFGDKSYELIEGALVEKVSKSELHVMIVRQLFHLLNSHCPEGFFVQKEDPITLDTSEPEPDLALIEGDWRLVTKPKTARIVIEVAITSLTEDRAKTAGFARAGIPEFWIVRPESGETEIYREPEEGTYKVKETVDADKTIHSTALPEFRFCLAELLKQPG